MAGTQGSKGVQDQVQFRKVVVELQALLVTAAGSCHT